MAERYAVSAGNWVAARFDVVHANGSIIGSDVFIVEAAR